MLHVTKPQKAPCRHVDFRGLGPYSLCKAMLKKLLQISHFFPPGLPRSGGYLHHEASGTRVLRPVVTVVLPADGHTGRTHLPRPQDPAPARVQEGRPRVRHQCRPGTHGGKRRAVRATTTRPQMSQYSRSAAVAPV